MTVSSLLLSLLFLRHAAVLMKRRRT